METEKRVRIIHGKRTQAIEVILPKPTLEGTSGDAYYNSDLE